jgi:hypothetical protein
LKTGGISNVDPIQLAGATVMGAIGEDIGNQITKASTAISTLTNSTKLGTVANITGNTVAGVTTEGVKSAALVTVDSAALVTVDSAALVTVDSAALVTVDSAAGTDYVGDISSKVIDSIGSSAQNATVNNFVSGVTNISKLGQIVEIGVKFYSEISNVLEAKK